MSNFMSIKMSMQPDDDVRYESILMPGIPGVHDVFIRITDSPSDPMWHVRQILTTRCPLCKEETESLAEKGRTYITGYVL